MARRAHLGGAADAPGRRDDGFALDEGADPREGHHADAQRSSSSRCSTAGCSWPATPRTSSRRPAPRASTSRSPTCACSRAALARVLRARRRGRRSTATRSAACAASGACQHFSWWMTSMLHRLAGGRTRSRRSCSAPSSTTSCSSQAAATTLAENYVGLALPDGLFDGVLARGPVRATRSPTRRGCRRCSTSRPRWPGREARPGSSGRGRRGDRRGLPARGLRRRGARRARPPRAATRWCRSSRALRERVGGDAAAQVHRGATSQDIARHGGDARRPRARSRRCSTTCAARPTRRAALAARAPRDADGRAHAAPAGACRPRSGSRPRAG